MRREFAVRRNWKIPELSFCMILKIITKALLSQYGRFLNLFSRVHSPPPAARMKTEVRYPAACGEVFHFNYFRCEPIFLWDVLLESICGRSSSDYSLQIYCFYEIRTIFCIHHFRVSIFIHALNRQLRLIDYIRHHVCVGLISFI